MKSNLNVTESFLVKLKGEMVVASYWSKKIYIISTKTELIHFDNLSIVGYCFILCDILV